MKQVTTVYGYLVIERIGGLDVYYDDAFVCELSGKSLSDFSYDGIVNVDKLDDAIGDELDTLDVMEVITDPFNCI